MGRPKKNPTLDEQIELAEKKIQKYTEPLEAAKKELKVLLDQRDKDKEKKLLEAVASSKRSYEEIMEFIQSNPGDTMSGDQAFRRKISGSSDFPIIGASIRSRK